MNKKFFISIILLFLVFLFQSNQTYSQEAGIYVRNPGFVFSAGTPHRIIANDYPYSCWPYIFFPPVPIFHHHHHYYRYPVYHRYRHDYGRHNGWEKQRRRHRDQDSIKNYICWRTLQYFKVQEFFLKKGTRTFRSHDISNLPCYM